MNTETVTSQLVYEISGPLYLNSDVVANLEDVHLMQLDTDRVRVSNITGLPPPATTRVGVTAHGGYQAEWHFYLVGLDMQEKVQWMEQQARHAIGDEIMSKFTCLKFQLLGHTGQGVGVGTQDGNTADLRIFAQGPRKELFDGSDPDGFARKLYETVLQSCPVSFARAEAAMKQGYLIHETGREQTERPPAISAKALLGVLPHAHPAVRMQAPSPSALRALGVADSHRAAAQDGRLRTAAFVRD